MPVVKPLKRRELVAYFQQLGFTGPSGGTKHQVMRRGTLSVRIPNPHTGDIGIPLLLEILKQAGITRDEWERL